MGLNCYRSRELFSELLDGALDATNHTSVQTHLARCERCAGDYELFRRSTDLVRGLNPIPVAPDFTARVLDRLHAGGAAQRPSDVRDLSPRRRLSWHPFAVAAAAAAALAIGLWHWTALPRATSGTMPIANQAAPAPAVPAGPGAVPQSGRLAVTPVHPGVANTPSALRRPGAGAPALARKAGADSLYEQPYEGGLPPAAGYDRGVPVSASPAETSVHIH